MNLRQHFTLVACAFAVTGGLHAQPAAAAPGQNSKDMSCTLATNEARWAPSASERMVLLSKSSNGAVIRYVGMIDGVSVTIVDSKCDSRVFEVTLVGKVDDDAERVFFVLKKIEGKIHINNSNKLTNNQLIDLSNNHQFKWSKDDESAEYMLYRTDLSVILNSYYRKNY